MSKLREAAQAVVAAFELHGYSPLTIGAIWALRDALAEPGECEKVASDYADYQRSFADEYAELRAMGALEVMDRIGARGKQE